MEKLLFVNACIRENSRTESLVRRYLETVDCKYQIEEVPVSHLHLEPLDKETLSQRNSDISHGHMDAEPYRYARQFANADRIVIAAPYWDCLFPSALRVYLEHICVTGITLGYSETGAPVKKCRADTLVYLTTCGGFLPVHSAVESLIQEMGKLFSIDCVEFYAAEGLDINPEQVPVILDRVANHFTKK